MGRYAKPGQSADKSTLGVLTTNHPYLFLWAALSVLLAAAGLWFPTGSAGVLCALAVCTWSCFITARRSNQTRYRSWLLFTAGWFTLTVNYFSLAAVTLFVGPITAEFSPFQVANSLAIALIGAAMVRLISANEFDANRRTLDLFTVSCGMGIILWAIVLSEPNFYQFLSRGGSSWWAVDETISCVAYLNTCLVFWLFFFQDSRRSVVLLGPLMGWLCTTGGFAAAVYFLTMDLLQNLEPFSFLFTAAPLLTAWVVLTGRVEPPQFPRKQRSQQPYLQHTALTIAAICAIVLQLLNPRFDPIAAFLLSTMMVLVMIRSHFIISNHEKLMRELQLHKLKLSVHAFEDDLTGLDNRRKFFTTLSGLLARQPEAPISIVYLDLDRFKQINDTFGHQGGDTVLKNVAARLREVAAGTSATIARLAGDEFTIATVHHGCTTGVLANQLASRVHQALQQPHRINGQDVTVTASVGVAVSYPNGGRTSAAELIRQADVALYAVKAGGRDAHQRYGDHLEVKKVVIPEQPRQLQLPLEPHFSADEHSARAD